MLCFDFLKVIFGSHRHVYPFCLWITQSFLDVRTFQPSIHLRIWALLRTKCQRSQISITTVFIKLSLTWTLDLHQIANSTSDLLLRVTDSVTEVICIADSGKTCLMNCIISWFFNIFVCFLINDQFLIIYQVLITYQYLSLEGDLGFASGFKNVLVLNRN